MKTLNRLSVAITMLSLAVTWPSPVSAQTVPFKVFITELWQLDTGVDPVIGVIGDYYAKVTINGVEQRNDESCNDETSTGIIVPLRLFKNFSAIPECSAPTPWVFTQQVPASAPVQVIIRIFDVDTVFDDEMDLKPGSGSAIAFTVNPTTGQWTGDVNWPQICSRPNLEQGGSNANVCWQAGFDSDEDGLLDGWELLGVDTDNDGSTDIDLPGLGANPLRKDVFVEADYLFSGTHIHAPKQDAISQIVTSFANAPVGNLDGTTGAQLHVDVGPLYGTGAILPVAGPGGAMGTYGDLGGGNAIDEPGNEVIEAFYGPQGTATEFADLKAINFNGLREYVFRYAVFGHQTNARAATNDCTTGQANPNRRDFLVTLGGIGDDGLPCWDTENGFSVGSILQQGGTFMHGVGHTLGLFHGGNVEVRDKPNYLSVMNYPFQACAVPVSPGLLPGGCDYSRRVSGVLLPALDETDLDECVGIGGGLGFGAVDWNGDGSFQGVSQCGPTITNTTADVNNDGLCISPGINGTLDTTPVGDDRVKEKNVNDGLNRVCDTAVQAGTDDQQNFAVGSTPPQANPLTSFDDWNSLNANLIDLPVLSSVGPQEADPTTLRETRLLMSEMMAPNVAVDETGPATGAPGDLLTYTITITNTGRGPALSAVLQATRPDGTSQSTEVGILTAGAESTHSSVFTVPANACPGDLTSASALLSFKDFAGQAITAADSVPLQILDVAPPTLEVSLSPNVLWPPNHQFQDVTATITVADNCDPNPTVALVSITSSEPAAGWLGNGDQGPDIRGAALGTDDRLFSLRSERGTGKGSTGRVYTVIYRVTDTSGNTTEKNATVTVPTSNSGQ